MAQPTRIRTRLAREQRREQIVDAAAVVFRGRDPAEVTFEEIADAAGVSPALVYNYFGDRHGLVEAVYRRNVDLLKIRVTEALSSTRGRANALAAAVRVHLQFAVADPHGYRFAAGEPVFARLPDLEHERVGELAANFGGGPDGLLVAQGMLSALQAMVMYWLEREIDDTPIEQAVDVITGFLLGALDGVDRLGVHITPRWRIPS